jgi:hypothetical protein
MLRATILAALALAAADNAFAQEGAARNAVTTAQRVGPTKPSRVVSKVHQPVGTPHKASSFVPHKTNKRVYGAPIQAPIVHRAPTPK